MRKLLILAGAAAISFVLGLVAFRFLCPGDPQFSLAMGINAAVAVGAVVRFCLW